MIRFDISNSLIHLTRVNEDLKLTSENVFDKIVREGKLLGSTQNIRGNYKCICFSETPINAIGQIIAQKDEKFHYGAFGFLFRKKVLFELGARPVYYQPDSDLLPEELKYRHVRFNVDKVDWTWEREWRMKTDELVLDPQKVTLIVRNRNKIEEYKEKLNNENTANSIIMDGIMPTKKLEWHFISLEDLS
jgi:hypothetical protein